MAPDGLPLFACITMPLSGDPCTPCPLPASRTCRNDGCVNLSELRPLDHGTLLVPFSPLLALSQISPYPSLGPCPSLSDCLSILRRLSTVLFPEKLWH